MSFDSIYEQMKGFVVSYKLGSEPLLFNELQALNIKSKLQDRGTNCAVFHNDSMKDFMNEIREENLIFAGHIHPYASIGDLAGEASDWTIIESLCLQLEKYLDKNNAYVCQCRISSDTQYPYGNQELVNFVSEYYKTREYMVNPQEATIAISMTIVNQKAYLGLSPLQDNMSSWTGGILFYSKNGEFVSRAEFKLEEAVEVFQIDLSKVRNSIDLGAAPGGWTYYLSKNHIAVDAVDPANLSELVTIEDNVTHYKMTAQEFLRTYPENRYDLIVNDMKMDSRESVDIICFMSEQLKEGGLCVLTLKLPEKEVTKRIKSAKLVLGKYFKEIKVRQLYYNRSEVTVFARK